MGGNIFPQTARISPADYALLKATLTATLKSFFAHVSTPLEAPSKPSHGDIDFLVSSPLPDPSSSLASAIKAQGTLTLGPTTHFAIPYNSVSGVPALAQIDVQLCRSAAHFSWLAFRNAHGIGGAVLGALFRPLGLVLSDDGLYVELSSRKKDRVLLSGDPVEVLRFAGLDAERWFTAFETVPELYGYLASCRLLGSGSGSGHKESGVEKRPLYSGFWEYAKEQSQGFDLDWWEVMREAVEFFEREEEYERARAEVEAEDLEAKAVRLVKEFVAQRAEGKDVPNLVVRALRRWAILDSGELAIRGEVEMAPAKQIRLWKLVHGEQLSVYAQEWLDKHWLELRNKERTRAKSEKASRMTVATTIDQTTHD